MDAIVFGDRAVVVVIDAETRDLRITEGDADVDGSVRCERAPGAPYGCPA